MAAVTLYVKRALRQNHNFLKKALSWQNLLCRSYIYLKDVLLRQNSKMTAMTSLLSGWKFCKHIPLACTHSSTSVSVSTKIQNGRHDSYLNFAEILSGLLLQNASGIDT